MKHRKRQPELMDQPGLDAHAHDQALRGIERINRWTASAGILWPAIAALAREAAPRPIRVLDVATGAGDLPMQLLSRGQRLGIPLAVDGCDVSEQALTFARNRAEACRASVSYFLLDAFRDELPGGYDVITCSLFLHHLDEAPAIGLLEKMSRAAGRLVLVNDLVRSEANLALVYLATRLLTRSPIVHVDGPLSVRAAFTVSELRAMATQAGLTGARIETCWPCRMLLTWKRPV